ncbi:MAG: hypothetical protein J0H40_03415 [Rhizobiales bacterium]|nr:hypothetical protein [Hyphomicrobiales bacterium]
MLARFLFGALVTGAIVAPAMAGQMMTADEAKRFVAGKVFAFTCFDGTRGAGRVFEDGGAAGAVQFSGSGPVRHMRLPGNTLQVRGQAVCASIKGIPFEPCFNLDKKNDRSFRGSVSGMGFAYCDFNHQGGRQMLLTRAVARPHTHSRRHGARTADASNTEITARVETPQVESAKIDPVKPVAKSDPAKDEGVPELRRSTE